ncbi:hypothetical protein [Jiangella muralis]|uniref:hypothetical protein n=1 Tax=Jiangella muralis TaxID=702383 RepID=UPI000AFA7BA5|nr:hypothetical protein [Jiangella muralis]
MTVAVEAPPAAAFRWAGDVLDECGSCGWWVRVDELHAGSCTWCRGAVLTG